MGGNVKSPAPWRNEPTRLYHGTLTSFVPRILERVEPGVGAADCDFGQGFYTTTWEAQAWDWARRVADLERLGGRGAEPAVVYFDLARNSFAGLDVLAFVRGEYDAAGYWSLVWHCHELRGPHRPGAEPAMYDAVVGPVAKAWRRREAFSLYEQFSFHTTRAAATLDGSHKGEVTWSSRTLW